MGDYRNVCLLNSKCSALVKLFELKLKVCPSITSCFLFVLFYFILNPLWCGQRQNHKKYVASPNSLDITVHSPHPHLTMNVIHIVKPPYVYTPIIQLDYPINDESI